MKRALKILAIYIFLLPAISDIIGFFFEHSKIKYIARYPFSYIFETIFTGGTLLIPYLVLLGLAYINLFRRKPDDNYFFPNKIATISATAFIVAGATLVNIIWFLNNYLGIHDRFWITLGIYGIIPATTVVLVLVVYGLGYMVGWLIKVCSASTKALE